MASKRRVETQQLRPQENASLSPVVQTCARETPAEATARVTLAAIHAAETAAQAKPSGQRE